MVTLILTLNIQDKIYLCLQKRKDEEGAMDDSTLIEQIQLGSKDAFKSNVYQILFATMRICFPICF